MCILAKVPQGFFRQSRVFSSLSRLYLELFLKGKQLVIFHRVINWWSAGSHLDLYSSRKKRKWNSEELFVSNTVPETLIHKPYTSKNRRWRYLQTTHTAGVYQWGLLIKGTIKMDWNDLKSSNVNSGYSNGLRLKASWKDEHHRTTNTH